MFEVILPIVIILALVISIYVTYKKRKRAGIKGLKSSLTSICCFLIATLNLFAYWLHFGGIITWLFSIVLLLVGAYFTKYFPISKKVH
ncbi:hypothetical protein BWGOE8_23500 [Bacillus mycoides]|uniref:Group-specific protein n=2 Tax=Bacillus cereus group TaxID=86661 RepID=A0A2C1CB61_BACCE|nr:MULTISPECIES: hypothetical protein [Bacillus cereus group]OFD79619.1 hypothetical protein BWGOE9_23550 [Bacillus mycoides]OFD79927.1 hypothetical protein BWGOE8_23500 [Bacillus mycoides]OFD81008.1 hypothetical protein BWGOE10_25510 [Bacillus mycoides]PGS91364.1 hypothetical protein COD09_27965 [Bacillus cereus]